MVGKFTVANAESFQRKKKRNKEEMDAEGPTLQSQKHLMQDIEYKSTGAEKYQWQVAAPTSSSAFTVRSQVLT